MIVQYVVFDVSSGALIKWGQCQQELVVDQAAEGQRALATSEMTVDGNRPIIWEQVKLEREARLADGAMTPFGVVQTDPVSRATINGLVTRALIAEVKEEAGFARTFTKADNSRVSLNAAQIIAVGEVVEAFVNAVHEHSQNLRDQIDAAVDMAELLAINISIGWP